MHAVLLVAILLQQTIVTLRRFIFVIAGLAAVGVAIRMARHGTACRQTAPPQAVAVEQQGDATWLLRGVRRR
ncbi:hypothetical protein ACFPAG_18460 [Vogesella sp. GCM10023246]|uniref:Secreted protein n=1 Tax=Vogesella oryzagri TaxID=3160864 RepID=A0ABV1M8Q8_9NEIS